MNGLAVATKAGALYALILFGFGSVLGTIRVLLVAPRFGETVAVILEAPLILAASWWVRRWSVERLNVRRTSATRSIMGSVAFIMLIAAEVALGLLVFGPSAAEQLVAGKVRLVSPWPRCSFSQIAFETGNYRIS